MSARNQAEESLLIVGRIVAPRGVMGELKVDLRQSDPELFVALKRVYLGEQRALYTVQRARTHLGQGLLQLEGVADREAAEAWRNALVYAREADLRSLEPDEYLVGDILGMQVYTDEEEALGEVVEIITTGANDVYVVRGTQSDVLIPAIKQVILQVDVSAGRMTVRLLDGLR